MISQQLAVGGWQLDRRLVLRRGYWRGPTALCSLLPEN